MKALFSPQPNNGLANVLIFLCLMVGMLLAMMGIFSFDLSKSAQSLLVIPLLSVYSYFLLSWPRRSRAYRWPVLLGWLSFWLLGISQSLGFITGQIALPLGTLSMLLSIAAYLMRLFALPDRRWIHWAKSLGVLYLLGLAELFIFVAWLRQMAPEFLLTRTLNAFLNSLDGWWASIIIIPLIVTTLFHMVDLRFFPRDYHHREEDFEPLLDELGSK